MDDEERLGEIRDVLDRLQALAADHVILVEGLKDVDALRRVGIEAEFYCVQSGGGPLKAAEHLWRAGRPAVIMTDWDRRGGNLAESLRNDLDSLCVPYDDQVRRDLSILCRPYSKDVESVDSVVALLESRLPPAP